MQADKRLKDLRDALWQAMIEVKRPADETVGDPYNLRPDVLAADLARHQVITGEDASRIGRFLEQYDPGEEGEPHPAELPDEMDTGIARIVANLRSWRADGDRRGGFER